MIKINEAIIVEGKYDKIKLSSLVDALIIQTDGFSIFKDKAKLSLIRRLADTRGIIVLTDSDGAGFKIRNYLNGCVDKKKIKHVYIPDVYGKERRKTKYSGEGKLGVEGMTPQVLMQAFEKAGVLVRESEQTAYSGREITRADLFEDGLTGGEGSAERRQRLKDNLSLPEHLSTNALLQVLNTILTYEEYKKEIDKIR